MYAIPIEEFPKIVTAVTLVSTPDCTSCPSIRRFFESRTIKYIEMYLNEASDEIKVQIATLSIKTAPVLVCDNFVVAAGGVQRHILEEIAKSTCRIKVAA